MVIWKQVIASAFPRTRFSESLIFPLFYDQIPNAMRLKGSLILIAFHLM
jgi:hypothetical protein